MNVPSSLSWVGRDGTVFILHAEYQEHLKSKQDTELRHIIADAGKAMRANPDGPKSGYYADEVSYAAMELIRRHPSPARR
jgi:hypothetical protein